MQKPYPGLRMGIPTGGYLSPTTMNSRLSQLLYTDSLSDCFVSQTQKRNQEEERKNGLTSERLKRKNNFGDMVGNELIKVAVVVVVEDMPLFYFR